MSVPMKYREIGDFHEYYSGARKAPYLTIFVGGNHEASNHLFELYYGGWVAPNIYYLGAANVIRFGPLRIAGLSGIWKGYNYNKPHHERLPYNQDDIKSIYHVREFDVRKLLQVRTQVDIGISHDWPRGVEWMGNWKGLFAKKDLFEADARAGTLGSSAAKYVMDRLRPPHWFAAHLHCKFSAVVSHQNPIGGTDSVRFSTNNQITTMLGGVSGTDDPALFTGQVPIDTRASVLQRNEDEIDIDMDTDTDIQSIVQARPSPALNVAESAPSEETDTVSDSLRAQLPASFARPNQAKSPSIMSVPKAITNITTRFLALDKCLPHRKFLQILEIDAVSEPNETAAVFPHELCYDMEWLAITRVFASDLVVGDPSSQVSPNRGEAYYHALIEKEQAWVEENIVNQKKTAIPVNFELTAPVYDAAVGIGTKEEPKEYTNPQTVKFCGMLGIPNPFDISSAEREARRLSGSRKEAPRSRGGRGGFRGGARGGGRGEKGGSRRGRGQGSESGRRW